MRSERLTYALIGCGRIAANHIRAAAEHMDITAVCDVVPERMEEVLTECGLNDGKIRRFTDYKEMIVAVSPQVAAVATESGNHAEIALYCVNKGIHTIIEKPITLSLSDADEIIRASEQTGVKVSVCHQNRFNKSIQKMREALEAGRFGKLFHGTAHIRWSRNRGYYEQAPWRGTWALDGGTLMNQCIHNIDLLRWMMGDEIIEVVGMTERFRDYIEAEDLGLALVRFANGSYGVVEGTVNVFPKNLEETLYIFGERGTAKAGGYSVNAIDEWRFADGLDDAEAVIREFRENPSNVYGFGHSPLYADFAEAVINDRKPYIDAHDGRRALELVLAVYKSAAEGAVVKLPLKDCSATDFTGMFK
jgi:predicted dehydrogenase